MHVFIQDSSVTTGAGKTGLAYNTGSLIWYYVKPGGDCTQITLADATLKTWTSGGFKEVSATYLPGVYEIGIPNACLTTSARVVMMLSGAANMAPCPIEIELVDNVAADNYTIVNHADYGNAKLVRSTTPANTLDVSADGTAGVDWANVTGKTTANLLTATTVKLVDDIVTANVTQLGGVAQSLTDLKDFADTGYDPSAHKVVGVVTTDTATTATSVTNIVTANVTQLGGVAQSLTDLKDFADAGYDPDTNKVEGVKVTDTATASTSVTNIVTANVTQIGGVAQSLTDFKDFVDTGYDPATHKIEGVKVTDTATASTSVTNVVSANVTQIGGVAQSATDFKDLVDTGYDPSTHKIVGVVTVDTTTTNTDMRGTNDALLAANVPTNFDAMSISLTGIVSSNITEVGGVAQSATDLKDFVDDGYDPSSHKINGVVLVDTTTTNSDMRGTNSALLAISAPTNFGTMGISATGIVNSNVSEIGGVVQSATDFKDLVDTGYDPVTHKVETVKVVDSVSAVGLTSAAVDAIWNEAQADHVTLGSVGKSLSNAAAGGDPWAVNIATGYSGDQAGYIVHTNLDAKVSTRSTFDKGTEEVAVGAFNASLDLTTNQKNSVNAACDTALTDYDPPTRTEATSDKAEIIVQISGVGVTVNAIEDKTEHLKDSWNDPSSADINTALTTAHGSGAWDATATATSFTPNESSAIKTILGVASDDPTPIVPTVGSVYTIKAKTDNLPANTTTELTTIKTHLTQIKYGSDGGTYNPDTDNLEEIRNAGGGGGGSLSPSVILSIKGGSVERGNSIRVKVMTLNNNGMPTTPDATPLVSVEKPGGSAGPSVTMVEESNGIYEGTCDIPIDADLGGWAIVATATIVGNDYTDIGGFMVLYNQDEIQGDDYDEGIDSLHNIRELLEQIMGGFPNTSTILPTTIDTGGNPVGKVEVGGVPIANAAIFVYNNANTATHLYKYFASADGSFSIHVLNGLTYRLRVVAPGYVFDDKLVTVPVGGL